MRTLYHTFSKAIHKVASRYLATLTPPLWEIPKDKKFGDLSTMIALKIAPQIKKNPLEVAESIQKELITSLGTLTEKIDVVTPGFVNIFISKKGLTQSLNEIIKQQDGFFQEKRKRKVLLEFVSANPTGPLSIAHGRQAVVGDTIARILEFFGNEVTREYYLNDEGRQIDLLVASIKERIKEQRNEPFTLPENGYCGEYLKDIASALCEMDESRLREETLKKMITLITDDLKKLEITFTSFKSQRDLTVKKKVDGALNLLKKRGAAYEKDGALWFKSTEFGDDKDRVLIKADGTLTYFSADIAYHLDKIKRKYNALINLWGPDHHGYIARVRAAIKALGYDDAVLNIIIIQLVTISTKERMSRRKGTAILLSDLIEEVGKDAARFYYLVRKNSSQLEFDIDLAKQASFDNPLYYIQYAHARIMSIFRKTDVSILEPVAEEFLESEELDLLRDMLQYSNCLDKAYYHLEPVFVIEYLKSLAASFHKYYEIKKVLSENKDITMARLNLLRAVQIVLGSGLRLLGIQPLERM